MEVVTAFQRHFRPARVDGIADHSTLTTLHALLSSLPPDALTRPPRANRPIVIARSAATTPARVELHPGLR